MNRWRTYPLPTLFVFPQPLLDYLRHFYSTQNAKSTYNIYTASQPKDVNTSFSKLLLSQVPVPWGFDPPPPQTTRSAQTVEKRYYGRGLGWVSTTLQFPRKKGFDTKCADIRNRAPTLVVPFMLSSTIGSCMCDQLGIIVGILASVIPRSEFGRKVVLLCNGQS